MADSAPHELVYGAPRLPDSLDRAVLLIDKPPGWTSFDVVRKLRRLLNVRKIGHAGTLDPMATGLLIVLMGRATKLMEDFMQLPKAYEGVMRLGETTPSYDAETPVECRREWRHVTDEALLGAAGALAGEIEQRPPIYSAVKVGGERLYRKARRGEVAERPPRQVHVYEFRLRQREGQDLPFTVRCSKGTYIRSLAHDLGEAVGAGAHLVALRRTEIGPYSVEDAWQLSELEAALSSGGRAAGRDQP